MKDHNGTHFIDRSGRVIIPFKYIIEILFPRIEVYKHYVKEIK